MYFWQRILVILLVIFFSRKAVILSFEWVFTYYVKDVFFSIDQLIEIMMLDHPTEYDENFYRMYLNLVLSVFQMVCRNLKELHHLVCNHSFLNSILWVISLKFCIFQCLTFLNCWKSWFKKKIGNIVCVILLTGIYVVFFTNTEFILIIKKFQQPYKWR